LKSTTSKTLREMIPDWNVPEKMTSITIARLISELEGCSYLLKRMEQYEDFEVLELLKNKYYKMYFQIHKIEKSDQYPYPV
jgi:hypothetical protein